MGITEDRRQRDDSWDADNVRRLRRHAGLSQRELAQELNARQQTISEWERGAYAPRGTAARLLTRVAEDVQFPFEPDANVGDDGQTTAERRDGASGESPSESASESASELDDARSGDSDA